MRIPDPSEGMMKDEIIIKESDYLNLISVELSELLMILTLKIEIYEMFPFIINTLIYNFLFEILD